VDVCLAAAGGADRGVRGNPSALSPHLSPPPPLPLTPYPLPRNHAYEQQQARVGGPAPFGLRRRGDIRVVRPCGGRRCARRRPRAAPVPPALLRSRRLPPLSARQVSLLLASPLLLSLHSLSRAPACVRARSLARTLAQHQSACSNVRHVLAPAVCWCTPECVCGCLWM
jgi:hypothetical protein